MAPDYIEQYQSKILKKLKLDSFPEPEYIKINFPILLCHGYGAIASMVKKKSPLYDVCMLLRSHGVLCFAPNIVPYARIETRAKNWKQVMDKLCEKTGCQKFNILAHSMGGLDIRYGCQHLGLCKYIASFTTIATPHRGASLADYALEQPEILRKNITSFTDWIADYIYPSEKSDTNGALQQLSTRYIQDHFNQENQIGTNNNIPCFSYSAALGRGTQHPISKLLNFQNKIIFEREGINDGFVSVKSSKWGLHRGTVDLSHLEQIKMNISQDRIAKWEQFWLDVIKTLSEETV